MPSTKNDVVLSFISLTEKIANSKMNTLDFGSPEMTFYRGEIHMIKIVGDYPGIYSSELARQLGITRAVVHRTVTRLENRKMIVKESDAQDRKKMKLYLTSLGQKAYQYHEDYHQKHDQQLFDYLDTLSTDDLVVVDSFLKHATGLIDNHA